MRRREHRVERRMTGGTARATETDGTAETVENERTDRSDDRVGKNDRGRRLRVLNLVTTPRPFFEQQVTVLERAGVESTTLVVPGRESTSADRSVGDYLRYYPRVLRRSFGSYDLIHANYGVTAPFALAQPNLPVVLSLWGSELLNERTDLGMRAVRRCSQWCAKRCDAVIVMSEEMATALDCACHVIPHGIDTDLFEPRSQQKAQADLGWEREAKHVLFPYSPTRAVKNYPRAERVVRDACERLDVPVELQVAEGVAHEEVPTFMNAADVLLMTSRSEGSPNTVKEALACSLPVVSTDVGDVRDRLAGVTPSAVASTDEGLTEALVRVLESGARSDGRETVRELGLDRTGEELRTVYESVVRNGKTTK